MEPIRVTVHTTLAAAIQEMIEDLKGGVVPLGWEVMEELAYVYLGAFWPCTASELEEEARVAYPELREGSLRKRLNDLREKGLAEVIDKRKCKVTGRTASVWRAVSHE